MAEFKVIETQEEFDSAIQKRLAQKEREVTERFKGYLSPDDAVTLRNGYEEQLKAMQGDLDAANERISGFDSELSEWKTKASKAEHELLRGKVAAAKGLPFELSTRLVGTTKEELEADADTLASFVAPHAAPPLRTNAPAGNMDSAAAARNAFAEWFNQFNQG